MTRWPDGQKIRWPEVWTTRWSDGQKTIWSDVWIARIQDGQKSRWHVKQILKNGVANATPDTPLTSFLVTTYPNVERKRLYLKHVHFAL